mmetsp:Transcript_10962/g.16143  ORF Transcript_10962/g.16143 Transcript_10962/m.16143 type:complete len:194 (-) Transcript_10962:67-648(-)
MLTTFLTPLVIFSACEAFTPAQLTATSPDASLLSFNPTADGFSEERNINAILLLHQAVDCSLTDSCPVEEAEMYINEIKEAQSMCLVDTPAQGDFCSNQDIVSDVISRLNQKINPANTAVASSDQRKSITNSILDVVAAFFVAILMMVATSVAMSSQSSGITGFTAEEWWWAVRDGYFPLMVIEYIKHGGLAV